MCGNRIAATPFLFSFSVKERPDFQDRDYSTDGNVSGMCYVTACIACMHMFESEGVVVCVCVCVFSCVCLCVCERERKIERWNLDR